MGRLRNCRHRAVISLVLILFICNTRCSIGEIIGNILGAYLGIDGINKKFLDKLEIREVIENMAKRLYD